MEEIRKLVASIEEKDFPEAEVKKITPIEPSFSLLCRSLDEKSAAFEDVMDFAKVGEEQVLIATNMGKVYLCDVETNKVIRSTYIDEETSKDFPNVIVWNGKAKSAVIGSEGGVVSVWDLNQSKITSSSKAKWSSGCSSINAIGLEGNEDWILCGHDEYLTKWSLSGLGLAYISEVDSEATSLLVDPLENIVYSGHANGTLQKWTTQGNLLNTYETSNPNVNQVQGLLTPHSKLITSTGDGNYIDVFQDGLRLFSYLLQYT
eukprot:TRINITY_DN8729_c0_g1_i4.p1 TRINITY_DN8729_c0_g1~~TRINITY_DN8729_c0_g1_i4.p1  ORF type:complete len:261 (-),score=43.55 TRINITY_DN8729_c0_g1_i4:91-873(-)